MRTQRAPADGPQGGGSPSREETAHEAGPHARASRRAVLASVLVMLAFLAATNHWLGWHQGVVRGSDLRSYAQMGAAAPGFPGTKIGSAYTERFASPWVGGSLGAALGISVHAPFRIIVALCLIVILALLISICAYLGLGLPATLLCVGLLVLNPYAVRAWAISPSPVDPLFVTGLAIVLWALVTQRLGYVIFGAFVAILGRQSALLAVPAAALWMWRGEGWRARSERTRILAVALAVGTVLVTYGVIKLVTSSFTFPFAPSIPGDTVLPVVGDPGSTSELVKHVLRVAAPLVLVAGSLLGLVVGLARGGDRLRPPVEFCVRC